ncbi:DEAD/DEAH box helicase family protein [Liquorilactobacillus vini]|uniref:DEAD/DEAH box helicase family protein n=1 Tax=Liquorilactobacillus vini TaxID=238015 RepID=UPI0002E6ADE9|nr:DEAD/DEAH box helicase family protein [Liquorilactobacillus vini]
MKISDFYGRLVTVQATTDLTLPQVTKLPAIKTNGKLLYCQRCQQTFSKKQFHLPNGVDYCPYCLQFGRLTSHDLLYTLPEPNLFPINEQPLSWQGKLSPLQQKCAQVLKEQAAIKKEFLLWAVTGAGKTEIMFPAISEAIKKKNVFVLQRLELMFAMNSFPVCSKPLIELQLFYYMPTVQ